MADESALGIVFWTHDITALATFLQRVGGLSLAAQHPGFAELRTGDARVMLHADEAWRGHPWYAALAKEGVARGIGAEIRLRVADVAKAYRTALELGGLPITEPYDAGESVECQVMGPDGYLFALWQQTAP